MMTAEQKRMAREPEFGSPLTPKLKKMAEYVGQGMSWSAAAKHAGFTRQQSSHWHRDPRIAEVIRIEQEKTAKQAELSRQDVIDGLREAVQLAKQVSDPHALIKAWAELGRLCGFYAPEVKKLDISVTAKRAISQMEQLSERELLELAGEDIKNVIPGEFTRILEPLPALPAPDDAVGE